MPKKIVMQKGRTTINVDESRQTHYEGLGYVRMKTETPAEKIKKPVENKEGKPV